MAICMMYVTFPDMAEAKSLGKALIDEKLIACANFSAIDSCYWWRGEVEDGSEMVAILKTRPELADVVEARILALHSYDTPCVIRWEVRANDRYEAWIRAETER